MLVLVAAIAFLHVSNYRPFYSNSPSLQNRFVVKLGSLHNISTAFPFSDFGFFSSKQKFCRFSTTAFAVSL